MATKQLYWGTPSQAYNATFDLTPVTYIGYGPVQGSLEVRLGRATRTEHRGDQIYVDHNDLWYKCGHQHCDKFAGFNNKHQEIYVKRARLI